MWQKTSSQIAQTECTYPPELRVRRANQWASMDICDRKRGKCGAIIDYSPAAVACAHREAKTKENAKTKDSATISQRAAQIINGVSAEEQRDNVCPRCDRELYAFRTTSGLIMRCPRWDVVYIDQGLPRQGQREKYQLYPRWRFADWFWWPTRRSKEEHVARTRQWLSKPNSQQRLDSPDASLDVQPGVGATTIRSVASSSSTLSASSV